MGTGPVSWPSGGVAGVAGSTNAAGLVYVVPGSGAGLRVSATRVWSQAAKGVQGSPEIGDGFGNTLAAADFGGGPEADLAIGADGEGRGAASRAGMVHVLYGSSRGLTATGDQVWTQDSSHVPGVAESDDAFGRRLAAGNFDGRHKADLAVTRPSSASRVTNSGEAAADFNTSSGTRYADLAVVRTDLGSEPVVEIYPGGPDGLSQANPQRFTATDLGLPDDPRGQLSLGLSAAGSR